MKKLKQLALIYEEAECSQRLIFTILLHVLRLDSMFDKSFLSYSVAR